MPDKKKADKPADKKKADKTTDKKKSAEKEKPAKSAEKKPKEEKPTDAAPPSNSSTPAPVNNNQSVNNTPPSVLDSSHPRLQEYLQKVQHLHYKVNTLLIPKRDLLLNQLYASQYKKKEIQTSKAKVIHETQFYLQKIVAKLDEQERNLSAPINQKLSELEKSLSLIQEFLSKISKLSSLTSLPPTNTSNPFESTSLLYSPTPPPLQTSLTNSTQPQNNTTIPTHHAATTADIDMFLQFYNDYLSECEFLSANFALQEQSISSLSPPTIDFERKVSHFDMLERVNEELKRGMEWKDQMIKTLIQERDAIKLQKEQEIEALKKLYQKTKDELMKWIHLYDNNSYVAK